MDITNFIDKTKSEILNTQGGIEDVFSLGTDDKPVKGVKSDTDPQILINLHFKEPVKINFIKFAAPNNGTAPKKIKLFVNKMNLGFSEVEEQQATHEIVFSEKDFVSTEKSAKADFDSSTKIPILKFSKVSILTIFVEDNISEGEEEVTEINRIIFYGQTPNSAPSNVKVVTNQMDYNNHVKNNPGKNVIAYFHAPWCSHCRTTSPILTKLSLDRPELVIMSIDVDVCKDTVAEAKEVASVPHFKFYKDGKEITEVQGTPEELKNYVEKYANDNE